MISNKQVALTVRQHLKNYPSDEREIGPLLSALKADDGPVATRKRLSGHVTASGYVLDKRGRVLLIRHNALSRFLQPGGHTEVEDHSLPEAARREVTEETGVADIELILDDPINIGIHRIPHSEAKNEPEHWHFDFQYAFVTRTDDVVVTLQEDEVCEFAWIPLAKIEEQTPRERLRFLLN